MANLKDSSSKYKFPSYKKWHCSMFIEVEWASAIATSIQIYSGVPR